MVWVGEWGKVECELVVGVVLGEGWGEVGDCVGRELGGVRWVCWWGGESLFWVGDGVKGAVRWAVEWTLC